MTRVKFGVALIIAAVVVGTVAASAQATEEPFANWLVSGKALAPGVSSAVTYKGAGPTVIKAEGGLTIECTKFKGKGTVTGALDSGSFGTQEASESALSGCKVAGQPKCKVKILNAAGTAASLLSVRIRIWKTGGLDGELFHPSTWTDTTEWHFEYEITGRACPSGGKGVVEGAVDGNGLHNQEVEFPAPPLPASTLRMNGVPAVATGLWSYKLKGTKGVLEG